MTLYWKQSPGFLRTTMKRSCDNLANANHATKSRHANSFFEVGNLVQDQGVRAWGFQDDLVFNWRLACAVTAEPARSPSQHHAMHKEVCDRIVDLRHGGEEFRVDAVREASVKKIVSKARAHCGTVGACYSKTVLPAASWGPAVRVS